MDPIQIPVPTAPIAAPTVDQSIQQIPVQAAPVAAPQEDFFDKFLKGLVDTISKLVSKPEAVAPTVPLGAVPQAPIAAPQAPAGIFNTIGSGIENVANQAVNVAQTGVNSVVQNAQDYIAQPAAPVQSAVDVQNFLSQNYQSATPQVAPVIQEPIPQVAPVEQVVVPQAAPQVAPVEQTVVQATPTTPIQ
jgi:hypothetical protein